MKEENLFKLVSLEESSQLKRDLNTAVASLWQAPLTPQHEGYPDARTMSPLRPHVCLNGQDRL